MLTASQGTRTEFEAFKAAQEVGIAEAKIAAEAGAASKGVKRKRE